jgi:hypothetical protein
MIDTIITVLCSLVVIGALAGFVRAIWRPRQVPGPGAGGGSMGGLGDDHGSHGHDGGHAGGF